ncbi:hypothetical protein HPB48_021694 [Haemaphysalis longicornis]|uniref:Cyclin C-terminal domain-containing protein n=1 Tax=Haemaphysalis longicornis TaxID=44386 RepID=A0A9J6FUX3_HAELO|nr:hypothetical protein HPB48_021694 [Haemaphysalis longicornis]
MEVSKAPAGLRLLAQYFCELALLDDDPYLQFPPSVIVGAAVCLVHPTFGRQPWGVPDTRLPISRRASPAFTQALVRAQPLAKRRQKQVQNCKLPLRRQSQIPPLAFPAEELPMVQDYHE